MVTGSWSTAGMPPRKPTSLFPLSALIAAVLCGSLLNASAGTLTGSFNSIANNSTVNLTTAGKIDWVHWGLYGDSSINRKHSLTPILNNFVLIGDTNSFIGAYQYGDNANGYSWSDGSPVESATNSTTGVYAFANPTVLGSGFRLVVPADTSLKTLQVYVGAFGSKGQFTASLSDASASSFTNSSSGTVDNHNGGTSGLFTINYAANSTNQTLTINWTVSTLYRDDGNVTLQAAALTAPGANNPPFIVVTNPVNNSLFAEPATITVQARAQDFDGTVTNVAFYAGTNKLGDSPSSPYGVTWTNAPKGRYTLTAIAKDNGGAASAAPGSAEVFVYGTGGVQTNAVALPPATVDLTAEGSVDWVHWGLATSASFDVKSFVPRRISNFTKIGTDPVQRYADNFTAFSWSDGTPASSAFATPTGVFTYGIGNGFQFTVPASTNTNIRTLRVYAGGSAARGELVAYLSDLSAKPYTNTFINNEFNNAYALYTIDYAAASPGQQLIVIYRSLKLYDPVYGNVTLQAATLQSSFAESVYLFKPLRIGNDFVLSFLTQSNRNYVIQSADSFPASSWQTIATLPGTGTTLTVTNTNASAGVKFYRVQTQ